MKIFFLLCLGLAGPLPGQTPTAQELAAHLDKIRRPVKSFAMRLHITEIRPDKPERESEFQVYARKTSGYLDFETVTVCLLPESDRGKVVLTKGTEAWLYDPKASRAVAISYRKFEDAFFPAGGLTSSFVKEYDPEYAGVEKVTDAANREHLCHHLILKVRKEYQNMAPGLLDFWLDRETLRPVREMISREKGGLLRTVYYTKFESVLGGERPTRLPMISNVERGLVIDLQILDPVYREMPADAFTLKGLSQVSKGELP